MRDPYLYDDIDVLINLGEIKNKKMLKKAEADITNISMTAVYNIKFDEFNIDTLKEINFLIFGQLYEWAGEFRLIQMTKSEDVLGGDTVRYSFPKEIKKELLIIMKEIKKLKRTDENDIDIVFRLVRIISKIWQIHPFREGNTRTVMVFSILLAEKLGFDVNHELFCKHAKYVRNSLVWASQGMYSKYEYIERIFYDALLGNIENIELSNKSEDVYKKIGAYDVNNYVEKNHEYKEK